MISQHIIDRYGRKMPELEGKFYNCIFDEDNGRYDLNKPHKHGVIKAWYLACPSFIWDGICYEQEDGNRISGCRESDFSD